MNSELNYRPYLELVIRTLQNDAEGSQSLDERLRKAGKEADVLQIWDSLFPNPEDAEFEALQLIEEVLPKVPLIPILLTKNSPALDDDGAEEEQLARELRSSGYPALCTSVSQEPDTSFRAPILIFVMPESLELDQDWSKHLDAWFKNVRPERVVVLSRYPLPKELVDLDNVRLVRWERSSGLDPMLDQVLNAFLQKEFAYRKPPRFTPDSVGGEDLIGVRKDAAALSRLVCEESVDQLPLAIAIFGKWGSGKSFFMREVDKAIEKVSRKRFSSNTEQPRHANEQYVRITFNAWHYVESNLWASLASHIFENLYQSGEDKSEKAKKERIEERQRLIRRLDETRRDRDLVDGDIEKARQKRDEAYSNLLRAKEQETANRSVVERIESGVRIVPEVWKNLDVSDRQKLAEPFSNIDPGIWEFITKSTSLIEVEKRVNRLTSFGSMIRRLPRRWLWTAVGLFFIFGILSLFSEGLFPVILTVLSPAGTFLAGGFKIWCKATDAVDDFHQRLAENNQAKLEKLRATHQVSLKTLAEKEMELEQINEELREIERSIENTYSLKQLINFLKDRAVGEDYNKHLGLLALLRRDFETLERLMREAVREDRDGARVTASGDKKSDPLLVKPIRRIILFIDDLDRCPPKRVVEVLQAIHMLLAFPLFVVVVGVDSRWVWRCLNSHYGELLKLPENGREFEPSNYLEKIFQFPYWLPPLHGMRTDGYLRKLIHFVETPNADAQTADEAQALKTKKDQTGTQDDENPKEDDVAVEEVGWTSEEIDDLERISPLAGDTPRAIKRYFNMYRVLRSHPDIWPLYFNWREGDGSPPWHLTGVTLALCNTSPKVAGECYLYFVADRDKEDLTYDSFAEMVSTELRLEISSKSLCDEFVQPLWESRSESVRKAFQISLQHSFHGYLLYAEDWTEMASDELQKTS